MLKMLNYLLVFLFILFIGCGDSASDGRALTTHPGYEYMPDMYRSPSYETYSENPLFKNTESTQSTARVGLVHSHVQTHVSASSFYFVFSVEFFFKRAKLLLFFLSVYVKKKKSQTLGLSSVRGRNAPPCFVYSLNAEVTFKDDRGLEDRAIARQNHMNEYTLNALQVTKEVFAGRKVGV